MLRRFGPLAVVVAAAIVASAFVASFASSRGMLTTPDSATYLTAADHLAHGKGFTAAVAAETTLASPAEQLRHPDRVVVDGWPPGYSTAIAATILVGLSPTTGARVVNVVATAALGGVVVLLAWALTDSLLLAAALATLVLVSPASGDLLPPGVWPMSVAALSESLYLLVCVVALAVGAWAAVEAPRVRRIGVLVAASCVAVAAATMVHFLGVAVGLAVAAGFLVGRAGKRRWGAAAASAGAGPAALALLSAVQRLMETGTPPRAIAWHPWGHPLGPAIDRIGSWLLLPGSWPIAVRAPIVLVAVAGPAALSLTHLLPRNGTFRDSLRVILAWFVPAHLVVLAATAALLDRLVTWSQRSMAPAQIALYLALGSTAIALAATHRHNQGEASGRTRARVQAITAITGLTAVAMSALAIPGLHSRLEFSQYEALIARQSRRESPWKGLSNTTLVFSNLPGKFWITSGHGALMLPLRHGLTTGQRNNAYQRQVNTVVDAVREGRGLILLWPVFGDEAVNERDYARGGIAVVARCKGFTALATPATAVAEDASRRCHTAAA